MIAGASFFTTLFFGFILGIRHAFDADHVVAVSTMLDKADTVKHSSFLGAVWGMGHTAMLLFVGIAVLLFKLAIPEKMVLSFEFLVGFLLLVLGISALRTGFQQSMHFHQHRHGDVVHAHFHRHDAAHSHTHTWKTFFVGLAHGLAGSGALLIIIVATMDSLAQGLFSILLFGLGSILGMMAVSGMLGYIMNLRKLKNMYTGIRFITGIASIVLGGWLMVEIGVMRGLLL